MNAHAIKSLAPEAWQIMILHYDSNEEKVLKWFQEPHPHLGGCSPVELIQLGKAKKLTDWIKMVKDR